MNQIQMYRNRIEKLFNKIIPKNSPHLLHQAMRYSLFSGGKYLRPLLVYGAGKLVNAPIQKLDKAALSVECIHTYSLIHDDLPCMDNDDYRRGKLSTHKKFGEYLAVLAGDALQALAFEILSGNNNVQQIKILSQSIGLNGMALGQSMDMAILSPQRKQKKIQRKKLYQIHHLKTAELITASLLLGAHCQTNAQKKLNISEMKKLKQFGETFGLAFQLRDDNLDKENEISSESTKNYFEKSKAELEYFGSNKKDIKLLTDILNSLLK